MILGGSRSAEIIRSYVEHPLRGATLLRRLAAPGRGVTQWDLSIDQKTELTDQNHVGGWRSTLELARAVGLDQQTTVLDLGSGLGGPARLIAAVFGSTVHGIELSPQRCDDAQSLTELVGLSDRVSFECADLAVAEVPVARFDVLWGQDAWAQLDDRQRFLARWSKALRPEGVIAFQEIVLLRPPRGREERRSLERLQSTWNATLDPVDAWDTALAAAGRPSVVRTDRTAAMSPHFARLLRLIPPAEATREERLAWREAIRWTEAGMLGCARWVSGSRRSSPRRRAPG